MAANYLVVVLDDGRGDGLRGLVALVKLVELQRSVAINALRGKVHKISQ